MRRTNVLAGMAFGLMVGLAQAGQAELSTGNVVGRADAPVTITEFSSLTCPHCAAFHRDTLPALTQRYLDTGKAKLVTRDFPLDGVALKAAVIAHCAGEQRYPTFVHAFFTNQQRWARAEDPMLALTQLAAAGGLSKDKIDACLADKGMEDAILASQLQGQQDFNIKSTPTFVINGKTLEGARGIEDFAAAIDPLLPPVVLAQADTAPAPNAPATDAAPATPEATPPADIVPDTAPAPTTPATPATPDVAPTPAPVEPPAVTPAPSVEPPAPQAEPAPVEEPGFFQRVRNWFGGLFS